MDPEELHALEVELRRVVDRLDTMPLPRAESAAAGCRATAQFIVDRTRALSDEIPDGARVPAIGAHGLGSMLAVVGRDYLTAVSSQPGADITPVLDALVALRRALA